MLKNAPLRHFCLFKPRRRPPVIGVIGCDWSVQSPQMPIYQSLTGVWLCDWEKGKLLGIGIRAMFGLFCWVKIKFCFRERPMASIIIGEMLNFNFACVAMIGKRLVCGWWLVCRSVYLAGMLMWHKKAGRTDLLSHLGDDERADGFSQRCAWWLKHFQLTRWTRT